MLPFPIMIRKNQQYDYWYTNNPNHLIGTVTNLSTSSIFGQNGPRACSFKENLFFSGTSGQIMKIDPENDSTQVITTRPIGTRNLGICTDGIYIYCVGGFVNSIGTNTNRVDRYIIQSNTWETMPNYPISIHNVAAAIDWDRNELYTMESSTGSFRKFNNSTNTWVSLTKPNFGYTWSQPCMIYNNDILYLMADSNFFKYKISTSTWSMLSPLTDISTQTNKYIQISMMGDYIYAVANAIAGIWQYRISTNTWSKINNTQPVRDMEPAIACAYNKAYAVANTQIYKII